MGHLGRAGAGDHPGRRRRRGRAARACDGVSVRPGPGARPGARDQRQPRARRSTAPGLALTCHDVLEFAVTARPGCRSRSPASAPGSCPPTSRTWSSAPSGPRATSSAGRRPGCASSPRTASRRGGGWARRRPPSSPASSAPGRCAPTSRRSTATPSCGWPPSSRATPTTSRPACSAARRCAGRRRSGARADAAGRRPGRRCRWCSCPTATLSTHVARGLLPGRRAARRRRVQRRPGRAAGARAHRRARRCCSRRPRTGCTSGSAPPRCPSRSRWSTGCAPTGHAAVVSGAGPSVLVLTPAAPDDLPAPGAARRWRSHPDGVVGPPARGGLRRGAVLGRDARRYRLGNEEHAGTDRCCRSP